jgi:putative endonuclease
MGGFPQISLTPHDSRPHPQASGRRWAMPRTGSKQQLGVRGEDLACAELERQGMTVLERNWRCRLGEIDIVAAETGENGLTLVFCEVKCRTGLGFGHPLEAITFGKMRTLRQLAALWMREHNVKASTIRLDAIGVVLIPGQRPSVTHVKAVG